jgi:hypothetical protein
MQITDLAPELQELVHQRQKEQGNDGSYEGSLYTSRSDGNFDWEDTPEGYYFWNHVDDGKDMTNHECYPKTINNQFPIY